MTRTTFSAILAASILAALPAAAAAQSTPVVKQLTTLMGERQLEALAARDPQQPDRYVAALLFPGVQLLLVSAQYPAPAELDAQLSQRNFRDVYSALQQPATAASRVFFLDLGCDGLKSGGDNVDVMYERGTTQILFDGNWKKQGLSETAYQEKLRTSDQNYTQLLTVLVNALKTTSTTP